MGGKLRSRGNALRHGLATRLENGCEQNAEIDDLAAILARGSKDACQIEQSRIVAECHFDLLRIRAARHDVFLKVGDFGTADSHDLEIALRAMDKITRYENRALSKRKRAFRNLRR
jgi:hypothetical protein